MKKTRINMLKKIVSCALITSFVFSSTITANACTSFYLGKDTTETGAYISGRSEDYSASWSKLVYVHPAEDHEPGDMYQIFEEGVPGFKWPYPARTLRYFVAPDSIHNENDYPEPYGEIGTNEKGVTVSATVTLSGLNSKISSATGGNDPMVSARNGGFTETATTSIVLMQAETARGACELMAEIIDTVGAAGREGTMISDANEVWFFQILSGHQYIAVKCPDDMIGLSPNITGNVDLSNPDNYIASPGLYSVAEKAGTLVLDENGNIKVADSYASTAPNFSTNNRLKHGHWYLRGEDACNEMIAAYNAASPKPFLNYFLTPRPEKNYSLYEAMMLLGYRGEDTPWPAGSGTGNGSSIGNDNSQECHVVVTRPDMPAELANVEWMTMGPAEFGLYLPFYGALLTDVIPEYYTTDAKSYNNADPSSNSMFWVFRELYTLCKGPRSSAGLGTVAARTKNGGGVKAFWERYQKSLIEQQDAVDERMIEFLSESRELADQKATEISMAISKEAYEYASLMLAELKEYQAGPMTDDFVPSCLLDEEALPHYAFVDGIKIANASATLGVGKTMTLTAVVSPDNAANKDVIWTSSNDKVATVEDGVVKAVSAGSVTIEARTVDGGFTRKTAIRIM